MGYAGKRVVEKRPGTSIGTRYDNTGQVVVLERTDRIICKVPRAKPTNNDNAVRNDNTGQLAVRKRTSGDRNNRKAVMGGGDNYLCIHSLLPHIHLRQG